MIVAAESFRPRLLRVRGRSKEQTILEAEAYLERVQVATSRQIQLDLGMSDSTLYVVMADARFAKIDTGRWTMAHLMAAGQVQSREAEIECYRRTTEQLLADRGPLGILGICSSLKCKMAVVREVIDHELFYQTPRGFWYLTARRHEPSASYVYQGSVDSHDGPPRLNRQTIAARAMIYLVAHAPARYGPMAVAIRCRLDQLAEVLQSDERFCRSHELDGGWSLAGSTRGQGGSGCASPLDEAAELTAALLDGDGDDEWQ